MAVCMKVPEFGPVTELIFEAEGNGGPLHGSAAPSLSEVISIPQGVQLGSNLVKELAKFLSSTQMANVLCITLFCSTGLKDHVPLISECFSIINTTTVIY